MTVTGQEGIAAVPDDIKLHQGSGSKEVFFLPFWNGKGSWTPFSELNEPSLSGNYTTQFKVGNIINYTTQLVFF